MKPLIPWMVGRSDLRRYLGRALDQCERGRMILIHAEPGGTGPVLLLSSVKADDHDRAAALAAFRAGRFKHVRLAALPSGKIRRRHIGRNTP